MGAGGDSASTVVPGFEPTEDQISSFIQITGAVRSVARGELHCVACAALRIQAHVICWLRCRRANSRCC